MNGLAPHLRALSFQPERQADKKTLRLEIDIWEDGSGAARVNEESLPDFIKTADQGGRKRIIRMLREAADLIEDGIV